MNVEIGRVGGMKIKMAAGTFWFKCQLSQLLPVCKKFQVELGAANGLVSFMGRFGIICKSDPGT